MASCVRVGSVFIVPVSQSNPSKGLTTVSLYAKKTTTSTSKKKKKFDVNLFVTTQENHLINLNYTLRICLGSNYFAKTENFLLKLL